MGERTLFLFTEKFPFKGGEPFLETEIGYLADAFDEVLVFPWSSGDVLAVTLPKNVKVMETLKPLELRMRQVLASRLGLLLSWFLGEIFSSRHRFRYLKEFKWNFYRWLGMLKVALAWQQKRETLKKQYPNPKLYTYWFNEWGTVLSLARCMGMKDRFVSRVHLYDFEEEFSGRGYLPFRDREMKQVHKVFPISEYAKEYVKKRYPETNMECLRLGVEDRGTNPISNSEAYTIVSCSSLSWYKRPLLLVEVLKHLTIPVCWIHLGDGPMRDAFLEASSELPTNVKFEFKGSVSNTEVISFYQQNPVDLVLNLSSYEGIPVSLMEAISFGIPIAGCNVCGMPEIVTSETGLLLDMSPNPERTASAIIDFLKTKSRNWALRVGVKEYWEQNFKANKNYPQFLKRL